MINFCKRRKDMTRNKYKMMNEHGDFLQRITKSLYYGELPSIPCLSLPVTELSAEIFSEAQKGKSLRRLHVEDAAELARSACVSPCSLVLALLYLERLKNTNPEYVFKIAPSELFLVSLMVSNKFLQDDGEENEVFSDEWAASAGISLNTLHQLEREFLNAIDWRVFVDEQHFATALEWLEHQVAMRQARIRGWYTYSDLANITSVFEHISLMKCLVTVYIALSVSYLASVSTLMASSLIVSHGSSAILNSNTFSNIVNSSMKYSLDTHIDPLENDTDHNAISTYPALLKAYGQVPEKLYSSINHYSNSKIGMEKIFYGNQTEVENKYTWPGLQADALKSLFQTLLEMEFFNLRALKQYLMDCDYNTEKGTLANIKKTYFTWKLWPSKWNQQYRYSRLWQYPQIVSVAC